MNAEALAALRAAHRARRGELNGPALGQPLAEGYSADCLEEDTMATDAIVGTGSIVGFDVNGRDRGSIGVKSLIAATDRGEQTRDLLHGQRFESEHLRDAIQDVALAVEKVGAAGQLTSEKLGAATQLAIEKTAAASILATEKTAAAAQLFAAQNHAAALAQAAECCCEIKELVREEAGRTRDLVNTIESNRVRDALADAKSEILALRLGAGGNGNGNNARG